MTKQTLPTNVINIINSSEDGEGLSEELKELLQQKFVKGVWESSSPSRPRKTTSDGSIIMEMLIRPDFSGYVFRPEYVNWGELADSTIINVLDIGNAALLFYKGLKVLRLLSKARKEVSKEQGYVMVALWRNRNDENKIFFEQGFAHANALREENNLTIFDEQEFQELIDELVDLNCIKVLDGNRLFLQEYVQMKKTS